MVGAERDRITNLLKSHICTLKKTSKDTTNRVYMCDSQLPVMHFDKLPEIYQKMSTCHAYPKSNDALYISNDGTWYLIEFKNGTVKKADVHDKIYDSVIMLLDLGVISDLDFARQNICYILVYNAEKNQGLQSPASLEQIHAYIGARAKQTLCHWDIDLFAPFLLKEAHTLTSELFQKKFVQPMELAEDMLASV